MITTSGVPLNKKKVGLFIELGLKYLNLSFDGNTTLGHGGGKLSYTKMFWKKVDMIQEVKRELGVQGAEGTAAFCRVLELQTTKGAHESFLRELKRKWQQ